MNNTQLQSLESEAGFRALFEYATVGILVINNSGVIELANPTIEKLFGYCNGELIGKPVEILIHESFHINHESHSKDYFENPLTPSNGLGLSLFARKKNGVEFPVEISLGHYELENEKLSVAFITDISIRSATEEKYRNLFENSLAAMFITDLATQRVVDVNEMGVHLFGYQSKEDFLKNYKPSNHFVNSNDQKETWQALLDKNVNRLTKEQEMKKRDDTPFWAKIFIKINHEKSIAQNIVLDITEVKNAHEGLETAVEERTLELTQSLEREKELNALKSRFVSMASHEFRTPLSAILTSVALIESYTKEDQEEKRKKHIERIKASVGSLVDILDDFLSLDKLEQGKVVVRNEIFDLPLFARDIIEELNGLLKHGQRINFTHRGATQVFLDKKILRNVILNLLTNAIKYSADYKGIYFFIHAGENMISIKVKDEGIGIPEDEKKNLFDKFFRAKNVANIEGTGLGLNIVKRYVTLLGGTIDFTSGHKIGTTFTIEIPINHSI